MLHDLKNKLISEITPDKDIAIALDFDGVCKLFTEYKHEIMFTLLFLHIREFQKVPFGELKKAYGYMNFLSKDYAGKARFLCINAMAKMLAEKEYDCALTGLDEAINELTNAGMKVNADFLQAFAKDDDVRRILAWNKDVDHCLTQLSGIGLTPGIKEHILDGFYDEADFYLVSTATESSIRPAMEKEDIFFIKRYFGQETAGKSETLAALVNSGYNNVFMFGDSLEDNRASMEAQDYVPKDSNLIFVPVIPGKEKNSFEQGEKIINYVQENNLETALLLAEEQQVKFAGKEAGTQW
jgi:hypothetical protein